MKILCHIVLLALIIGISGCGAPQRQLKSSLELQAIQAKEFETTKKIAFASVVSVFQDLGYIISTADIETGLITAKSATVDYISWYGRTMEDSKATAFIEEIRKGYSRIRLNFVNSKEASSGYGQKKKWETPIEDAQIYKNAFIKIQEAIFIRSSS